MPQPLLTQRITDRVQTAPAPVRVVWNVRVRGHERFESFLHRLQRAHYGFRDGIAWPLLGRSGMSEARLERARVRHQRVFDRVYETARTAHWYV